MAKSLHRLTDRQAATAPAGSSLNDGGGLHLRTGAGGNRRWVFRFKLPGATQREMGLGAYPAVTLAQARQKAAQARDLLARGIDPIAEAERLAAAAQEAAAAAKVAAVTFGHYADTVFLPSVLPRFSNLAHIQQWRATFRTHAAALRDKPLAAIKREDVLAILTPIWTTKSVTASRSRERIERLFGHAIQNGQFRGDNPASWRQFDATLPPPRKLTRGHHASIPHGEVAAFVAALRTRQGESMAALMLEFITLAACRTGEARLATWGEIDRDKGLWAIPAARMKMRRDHVVPITPRMATLLDEVARRRRALTGANPAPDDVVFPGARPGKPLSEMACLIQMRRMGFGAFTAHGLRATFKTWATQETDFPRELIEEQLAHQLGAVERAYLRGSTVERRRAMMEAWERHVSGEAADPAPGGEAGPQSGPTQGNSG